MPDTVISNPNLKYCHKMEVKVDKTKQRYADQKKNGTRFKDEKSRELFKKGKVSPKEGVSKKLLTTNQIEKIVNNKFKSNKEKMTMVVELIASIHYSHARRMPKDKVMIVINKLFKEISPKIKNEEKLDSSLFDVSKFVFNINKVFLSNEINEPLNYEFPEIKIGNEFTFTCAAFTDFKSKKESIEDQEADHDNNDLKVYDTKVEEWIKVMNSYGYKAVTKEEGKKGEKRLYYSFDLEDGGKWGYIVSLDDQCIEIITDPIAASSLSEGEVANIMDVCIFGVASQIGISAHETVGGGHINIDRAGAFEDDFSRRKLTRFLKEFYKDSAFWKAEDPDATNAPFPDELGLSDEEVTALLNTPDDKFIDKLESEIFTKSHKDLDVRRLDEDDVKAKNFKHYQAVNTEHYMDDNYDAQRIEIRRARAQIDRRKLAMLLDRIFTLLKKATSNYY